MNKETIYELIRKEDAVLWIGAGFSIYAGYPAAGGLCKELLGNLSSKERKLINKNLSLADLAEEFVRLKGGSRNQLIGILKSLYLKKPANLKYHEILSQIPHIKTIITTNYDSLFELAYGQRLQTFIKVTDIPYKEDNKIHLFKAHGDLNEPDSIIISKSDYSRFFGDDYKNNLFWSVVKEKISTKNVLFIGFGYEDINIDIVFSKINEVLGTNRKQLILVAPKFPAHKINYLAQKGIQYVNLKGEVFIDGLIENIKGNIVKDFKEKRVCADTFAKFTSNFGVLPDFKTTRDSQIVLKGLRGKDQNIKGNLTFSIYSGNKEIHDFLKGESFGSVEIASQKLKDISFSLNGINLLDDKKGNFKFTLSSLPVVMGTADVLFKDGYEVTNVPFKTFVSSSKVEIEAKIATAELKITHIFNNPKREVNFNIEHPEILETVSEGIVIFSFLKRLRNKVPYSIYLRERKETVEIDISTMSELSQEVEAYLHYFEMLKQIEILNGIRFTNISRPTQELYERVNTYVTFADGKRLKFSIKGEVVVGQLDNSFNIEAVRNLQEGLTILEGDNHTLEIYGHIFPLGFRNIRVLNPEIRNLNEFEQGRRTRMRIKSKTDEVEIFYTKTREINVV